ncbi:hypothetical protein [Dysosmobacter sp. Sow4_B12]|uniref:hypothetical protein n=1 Tax=Dysosmobacter sp. Sow4_B12 TaxID=3438777 RepID=UPI003F8DE6FF
MNDHFPITSVAGYAAERKNRSTFLQMALPFADESCNMKLDIKKHPVLSKFHERLSCE